VGLEALSRGADGVTFVERSGALCAGLRKTVKALGVEAKCRIVRGDALTTIGRLGREGRVFDVIWADPPYGRGWAWKVLNVLKENRLLSPDGWLLIETSKSDELPQETGRLLLKRHDRYGDTAVGYYTRQHRTPSGGAGGGDTLAVL